MNKAEKNPARVWAFDVLYDIAGSVIYAVGVNMFTAPNHIAPGGVTGIATMLNYLWGLPIGTVSFCINIPLLALSFRFLGRAASVKTLKSVVVMSVILDALVPFLPPYTGNALLSALFGGVCIGAGLALIFMRGATTGGTDIVARLLQLRFPYMPIGRAMLLVDCVVLGASSFVYGKLEAALYGLIAIFTCSRVLDSLLYGLDVGKMVLVISDKNDEISQKILSSLDRGATLLSGRGAYSGADKFILLTAVRKNEFHRLKTLVYEADPAAFVIVAEAGEIMGEGFKSIQDKTR